MRASREPRYWLFRAHRNLLPEPAAARERREEEDVAERRASFSAPNKPLSVPRGNTGGLTEEETNAVFRGSDSTNRLSWLRRLAPASALTHCPRLGPWGHRPRRRFLLGWETCSTWEVRAQGSSSRPPTLLLPFLPQMLRKGDPHPHTPPECSVNLLPSNSQNHPHEQSVSFF